MARMVADMLFLAKADHGLMLPSSAPVDVAQEVRELFDYYDALAEEAGVHLSLLGEGQIAGDRLMLRRALNNLLSNALRHTPRGGRITVGVLASAQETLVRVENTGTPIPADDLPYLFDRFYRADKSRSHDAAEGSGLGLAITRAVVQAHGGHISVASDTVSTRFELRLPTGAGDA
jgi:signal transduction histidine kinase